MDTIVLYQSFTGADWGCYCMRCAYFGRLARSVQYPVPAPLERRKKEVHSQCFLKITSTYTYMLNPSQVAAHAPGTAGEIYFSYQYSGFDTAKPQKYLWL